MTSTIDDLFRGYEKGLPAPEGLSEQNGPAIPCAAGSGTTIAHLRGIANRLPITGDRDLVVLVPWARHPDPCVSQIALHALAAKVGYDPSSLYALLEPDHFQVHDIFVSVKAYFDGRGTAHDPKIFDGLLLQLDEKDFPRLLHGTWQDEPSPGVGAREHVSLSPGEVRWWLEMLPPGSSPGPTMTTKIDSVVLNDRRQYVVRVSGAMTATAKGSEPIVYTLMPVRDGVMWFLRGPEAGWKKMKRRR